MAIVLTCSCGKRLAAKDEAAGKRVKCPACHRQLLVPFPAVEPVAMPVDELSAGDTRTPAASSRSETIEAPSPPVGDPTERIDSVEPRVGAPSPAAPVASLVLEKSRRYQVPSLTKRLPQMLRPAFRVAGRLPWFPILTALSAIVLVISVVALIKPTWIISPRVVTEPARNVTVNGAAVLTQTVSTRRFATFGMQWVWQGRSQKRIVAGAAPESSEALSLDFATPGTFVTDPNAHRFRLPGMMYAYEGLSDGRLLLLDSRAEVNLSAWWVIGLLGILPGIWIARWAIRRRERTAAISA